MSILVDTNLLLRSIQPESLHFDMANAALKAINRQRELLCVVPQVLYEFWAVCTRPTGANGLGMTSVEARAAQDRVMLLFALLPERDAILTQWRELVLRHDVKGRNSHDARLVAAMKVHGLSRILTFNGTDFMRYPGITIISP